MPTQKDFADGQYDCSVCGKRKPLNDFPPDKNTLSGRHSRCRDCKRSGERAYQKTSKYRRRRGAWGWSKYGIVDMTVDRYDAMLAEQDGVCAICGLENTAGKRLCVDHDHETGFARALLCTRCNAGMGQFNDDPALLSKAAKYLEHHKMKVVV